MIVCPGPASASNQPINGPVFGFVPLDLDTTATYSDAGGQAIPLTLAKTLATDQPFVSLQFSSTVPVRILVAKTKNELASLPDAPNIAQSTNQTSSVSISGATVTPAGALLEQPAGATNFKSVNGNVTAGAPVGINGSLIGGSGKMQTLVIGAPMANTAPIAVGASVGDLFAQVQPGGTVQLPIDLNAAGFSGMQIVSLLSTQAFLLTALYG